MDVWAMGVWARDMGVMGMWARDVWLKGVWARDMSATDRIEVIASVLLSLPPPPPRAREEGDDLQLQKTFGLAFIHLEQVNSSSVAFLSGGTTFYSLLGILSEHISYNSNSCHAT
jgi:hypothetical protein